MEEEFVHIKVKNSLNNNIIKSYDYIVCLKCHNKKYYSYNTIFYNDNYTYKQYGYKNKVGKVKTNDYKKRNWNYLKGT